MWSNHGQESNLADAKLTGPTTLCWMLQETSPSAAARILFPAPPYMTVLPPKRLIVL